MGLCQVISRVTKRRRHPSILPLHYHTLSTHLINTHPIKTPQHTFWAPFNRTLSNNTLSNKIHSNNVPTSCQATPSPWRTIHQLMRESTSLTGRKQEHNKKAYMGNIGRLTHFLSPTPYSSYTLVRSRNLLYPPPPPLSQLYLMSNTMC